MFNSIVESIVDFISPQFHPNAKIEPQQSLKELYRDGYANAAAYEKHELNLLAQVEMDLNNHGT